MANHDFDKETIQSVWQKAPIAHGMDSNIWRKDKAGALIKYNSYGDRKSNYGWEIDHIMPLDKGGSDSLDNLQPLHWANNASKGGNYPNYTTSVASLGAKNIPFKRQF